MIINTKPEKEAKVEHLPAIMTRRDGSIYRITRKGRRRIITKLNGSKG